MKIKRKLKSSTVVRSTAKALTRGSQERARNLADVQTETGRLLAALDVKRRYATAEGLNTVCLVLRSAYTLIDLVQEKH